MGTHFFHRYYWKRNEKNELIVAEQNVVVCTVKGKGYCLLGVLFFEFFLLYEIKDLREFRKIKIINFLSWFFPKFPYLLIAQVVE